MRVFVAGSTGTLGRPTVEGLVAAGHQVTGLARSAEKAALLRTFGARPVEVDLFDARLVTDAIAGHDAVLHLATRIPPASQMRKRSAWRDNDRLRNQGSSILVNAALATGAKVYVLESITFLYASFGDTVLYETAPIDAPWPLASAYDAERETARFSGRGGQGVVLRFGLFYAPYAPSTVEVVRMARWRLFPVIGGGDHYVSSIHVDDAAAAVVAALSVPAGVYNVTDDEPLPMREYVHALTAAFGLPRPLRVPPVLVRLMMGPSSSVLTRSQRVANTMFKAVSPWRPRHPNVREGFRAVAQAMGRRTRT